MRPRRGVSTQPRCKAGHACIVSPAGGPCATMHAVNNLCGVSVAPLLPVATLRSMLTGTLRVCRHTSRQSCQRRRTPLECRRECCAQPIPAMLCWNYGRSRLIGARRVAASFTTEDACGGATPVGIEMPTNVWSRRSQPMLSASPLPRPPLSNLTCMLVFWCGGANRRKRVRFAQELAEYAIDTRHDACGTGG